MLYQPKDQQDPGGRAKGGKRGAQGEEAEEDGAAALPLASKLGIQVAGVTIEDELEADQKLKVRGGLGWGCEGEDVGSKEQCGRAGALSSLPGEDIRYACKNETLI